MSGVVHMKGCFFGVQLRAWPWYTLAGLCGAYSCRVMFGLYMAQIVRLFSELSVCSQLKYIVKRASIR